MILFDYEFIFWHDTKKRWNFFWKLQFWYLVLLLNIVSLIDVICINKETVRSEYEYEWEEKRQHVCVRDLC